MHREVMPLTVASLHLYPIKSLGGFAVHEARITDRGFAHDRRWMLVDGNGRFISQREVPAMACLHCSPSPDGFRVVDVRDGGSIELPWALKEGEEMPVNVWDDALIALRAPEDLSAWFTEKLEADATLVFMPDRSHRLVDARYAQGIISLSDGFPYLIISQASLDDLNARIRSSDPLIDPSVHVPMDRFRPNMVIAGGEAYQEDGWTGIAIGAGRFSLVKPCARCVITTTDQRTGGRGKEPLRTLASYRRRAGTDGEVKVDFGMNAMAISGELVRVGDPISV